MSSEGHFITWLRFLSLSVTFWLYFLFFVWGQETTEVAGREGCLLTTGSTPVLHSAFKLVRRGDQMVFPSSCIYFGLFNLLWWVMM